MSAVELRPEESRGRLQDLVGPAQLAVLTLELADAGSIVSPQPGPVPVLDVLLDHPAAQRLAVKAELLGDGGDPAVVQATRLTPLPHEADRSLSELVWIHPRSSHGAPSFLHRMEPPRIPGRFRPPRPTQAPVDLPLAIGGLHGLRI